MQDHHVRLGAALCSSGSLSIESSAGGAAAHCWGRSQDSHQPSDADSFCLLVLSLYTFSLCLTVTVKGFSENTKAEDMQGRIGSIRG